MGSITGGLTGSLGSITGGLTGSLGSITGGLTGSLGSITSSLPLGSAIGITSAISSVKSLFGGKGGVRSPSVAVNTVNRSPVDNKVIRLLGDDKIPAPDYTNDPVSKNKRPDSITPSLITTENRVQELDVQIERIKQRELAEILQEERSRPAGDSEIQKRKSEIKANLNNLVAERDRLEK